MDLTLGTVDSSTFDVKCPASETFWRVLEAHNIRFTEVHNPTSCPIHDEGPGNELALAKVNAELEALGNLEQTKAVAGQRRDLLAQCRRLTKEVERYHLHLRQYEKQRAHIQDLEEHLKPGECVLYRDYVNDHDETGAKVCNLQLVVVYRSVENGPLLVKNIANLADKEACDTYFTADVFDLHMATADENHPGLLDEFHTCYVVWDHGSHFSANATLMNESTFFRKYGKKVYMRFLCSYHAFNRCDEAGVVGKRLAKVQQQQSKGPVGAAARSDLIDTSAYHNHVSFSFDTIDRGVDVFPAGLDKHPHARQCCAIKYHHTKDGKDVRKEGVVQESLGGGHALPAARLAGGPAAGFVHVRAVLQHPADPRVSC